MYTSQVKIPIAILLACFLLIGASHEPASAAEKVVKFTVPGCV